MNTPEHQENQSKTLHSTREDLVKRISSFFVAIDTEHQQDSLDYLNKDKTLPNSNLPVSSEILNSRQHQKARLNKLKTVLEGGLDELYGTSITGEIVDAVNTAAKNVAVDTNLSNFQAKFLQRITRAYIDDQSALPYARFVTLTLEQADTDSKTAARNKIKLAFEVFIGETGDKDAHLNTLRKIVNAVRVTHVEREGGRALTLNEIFADNEFDRIAKQYGLTAQEIREIKDENPNDIETENRTPDFDLETQKSQLLGQYKDAEARVYLDIELLSLSSDRLSVLLRTVNKETAEEERTFSRSSDTERLERLKTPEQSEKLYNDPTVKKWIDKYIQDHGLSIGEGETLRNQVLDYYLKLRNRIYLEKIRYYPRNTWGARDPFHNWIDDFNHNIIAAHLMMISYDPFLYTEYFKGQTAGAIRQEGKAKLDEAIHAITSGDRLVINDHMIYGYIMKDVHQGYLADMSQTDNPNYVQLKGRMTQAINQMKQESIVKEAVSFGDVYERPIDEQGRPGKKEYKQNEGRKWTGANVNFVYTHKYEDMAEGREYTQHGQFADPTLAHVTAVYPIAMKEFQEAFQALKSIADIASGKGDAEGLAEAAKKANSAVIDIVAELSPIAITAMQTYLRLIRHKLASNGGVITPDMFGSTSYTKGEFSKLLEMEIKNAHEISDFEKDVYLKMGMGLAFATNEMPATFANALPPMTLSTSDLPAKIIEKVIGGERLTIKEMKAIEGKLTPNFRDFSYRNLLINLNPLMWLYTWIKYNDFHVFNLGFVPHRTGENAMDPSFAYEASQQIMLSIFFGLSEDAVEYFDGTYQIPTLELARMNQKMSIEKRGGVRERVKQLLRKDFAVYRSENTGLRVVDGNGSFTKLMNASPILAYSLLTDPDIADTVEVMWEVGKDKYKTKDLPSKFKEERICELLDYMHLHYPTFFTGLQQNWMFRRKELNFNQAIREKILTNLWQDENNQNGYWLLLNQEERNVAITQKADIHALGDMYMHENIIATKRVHERLGIVMMELQTYLQENGERENGLRTKNIRDFILATDPAAYDKGMSNSLDLAVKNIRNLYNLQEDHDDQIRQMFFQYAQEVYYSPDSDPKKKTSIFESQKFLGITKLSETERKKIKKLGKGAPLPDSIIKEKGSYLKEYYARLINNGQIIEPFDWAYFDKTELNYQATGVNMTGRQIGDYTGSYMAYSTGYMDFVNAIQDAITKPGESKKIITEAFDKIDKKINSIATAYNDGDAGAAGWLATAFLTFPFIPSRWKDTPLLGKIPVFESFATLFNSVEDRFHQNAWDAKTRKEVLDHVLQKPWSKMILHYMQHNKKFDGFNEKMKLPWKNKEGKQAEFLVPIPKIWQNIIGKRWEKIYKNPYADFSVKSMKSFMKVEDWWVGGKENFGLGYNVLMNVFLIGLLLMLIQGITDGVKSMEAKA